MSAFVVSTVHIDAMLTAGLRLEQPYGRDPLVWFWPAIDAASDRGSWTSEELQHQARQRRRELTHASAGRVGAMLLAENRRSVDHRYDEQEWEEPYLFHALYQSCEHPDWPDSEAAAFCQALQSRSITCLPGYAAAPWEIDDAQVFSGDRR